MAVHCKYKQYKEAMLEVRRLESFLNLKNTRAYINTIPTKVTVMFVTFPEHLKDSYWEIIHQMFRPVILSVTRIKIMAEQ